MATTYRALSFPVAASVIGPTIRGPAASSKDEPLDQLRKHLAEFMMACNFARRVKSLIGLGPYECVGKSRASRQEQFNLDPIHQMPGLDTQPGSFTQLFQF
jgi:hypothetical protein